MDNIKQYYKFKENNKYGFKDLNNNLVVKFEYDEVTNFIDQLVWLKKDDLWNLYDIKNEEVVLTCEKLYFFNDKNSIISMKGANYIFNNQSKEKIKINYEIIDVQNQMFIKVLKNKKINFLNFDLKPIFNNWYEDIDYIDHGYFCIVNNLGKTIINIKEEKIFHKYFEDVNINSKDFFKVKLNGKWIFLDKNGGEYDLSKMYNYEFGEFKNLHLNFKAKKKSGFLNQFFEIKFKKKIELCSHVIDGYVIVKKYERFGVVNMKGRFIIKPIYNFISYDEKNIFYAERKNCSTYVTTSGAELFKIN